MEQMELHGWDIFYFVGAVLAVVLTIFTFGGHIVSVLESARRWMIRMWKSYREKQLFKKYKPSWEIIDSGNVEILEVGDGYQVTIRIKVKFKSRDARYETSLYRNKTKVILWHKKDDRDGDKYELKGSLPAVVIPPSGDHTVSLSFMKELKAQPLIDIDSYVKYIVYPGEAFIHGISEVRSLGVSNKRTAKVTQGVQGGKRELRHEHTA